MQACKFAPNIIVAEGTGKDANVAEHLNFEEYTRDTLSALDEIVKGSFTGWGLIMQLRGKPNYKVIITPLPQYLQNAFADPKPDWKSENEVQVKYNPAAWSPAHGAKPGSARDEVLLHELLHAYRMIQGRNSSDSCNMAPFYYDDFEEFFAILLTNIYRAAKGRKGLRKDHGHKNDELFPEFCTSGSFLMLLGSHISWVRRVVTEEWGYCNSAVRKDGQFNPVDYFLSHSAECLERLEKLKLDEFKPSLTTADNEDEARRMVEQSQKILDQSKTPAAGKPGKPGQRPRKP